MSHGTRRPALSTPAAPPGRLGLPPGGDPLRGLSCSTPGAGGLSLRRMTLALKPGKDGRRFRKKSHGSSSSQRSGEDLGGPHSRGGGSILHPTPRSGAAGPQLQALLLEV